jgi:hypothetical protein
MLPRDEVLVGWYKARDAFLGNNCTHRDYRKGLELAAAFKNQIPEAAWLCDLASGWDHDITPRTVYEALCVASDDRVFGATANAYLDCLGYGRKRNRPGEHHPLSREYLHPDHSEDNLARLVEYVTKWADCEAMLKLGDLYMDGSIVAKDVEAAKKLYGRAANLGYVKAWSRCGYWCCNGDTCLQLYWLGKAAQRGRGLMTYLDAINRYVGQFFAGKLGTSECILQIGAMYRREDGSSIFGGNTAYSEREGDDAHDDTTTRKSVKRFCRRVHRDARNAVNTWLVIGRRNRVVKDIRRVIGKLVWDTWVRDVSYTADPYNDYRPAMNTCIVAPEEICDGLN